MQYLSKYSFMMFFVQVGNQPFIAAHVVRITNDLEIVYTHA